MTLFNNRYRIESTRLKGWDYTSDGDYFITVCTFGRKPILGVVKNGTMFLNDNGKILHKCWCDLPSYYKNLILDEFVIMPDHFHGIMRIDSTDLSETDIKHGLFEFVRALKSFSARKINMRRGTMGDTVWQSRFYDSIIRDSYALERVRKYIRYNPFHWNQVS